MQLPNFKRLFKSDFDQQDQSFVEKFSFLFNNGIEVIYNALNKNLTFKDNILATVKDFTVSVNSLGIPKNITSVSLNNPNMKAIGLDVWQVQNQTNSNSFPSSAVFITWTQENSTVFINHITGLTTGDSYKIRVVVHGE